LRKWYLLNFKNTIMELLKKYNISETDLYTLALIEQKKAN